MPVLEEVKVTGYSMGDAPGAMSTDFLTEKPREAADEGPEERVTESDSGAIMVGLGDGSVRSIPPATDAAGVTGHESGLIYSGESGGLNESQVAAIGEMKWDNVAPAVEPYVGQGSWGLDRIDPLDDAAGPFFAYDRGFLGGVDVASASDAGFGGGVVVAAGDLDGYRPDMFGHFDLV